jgi:lysophospholipid acyltransferase (LPLAT)-like uncharacterized protein
MKNLLRHPLINRIFAAIMALYGKLVFATCRVQVITPVPAQVAKGPVIFALWHQHICGVPLLTRKNPAPLLGLMSASRDGTFTKQLATWFNIGAVVGSSSKGAVSGTRALVQATRKGHSIFLTPDGPRGPAFIAKQGVTEIARLTSLPVIPCAYWATSGHTFASWDSFRLPYPFSTITLAYGAPLETLTPQALQIALNTLTAQAQGTSAPLATSSSKL